MLFYWRTKYLLVNINHIAWQQLSLEDKISRLKSTLSIPPLFKKHFVWKLHVETNAIWNILSYYYVWIAFSITVAAIYFIRSFPSFLIPTINYSNHNMRQWKSHVSLYSYSINSFAIFYITIITFSQYTLHSVFLVFFGLQNVIHQKRADKIKTWLHLYL